MQAELCQWVIKCSLIIRCMQLKSCENRCASVQAGIPHEAISNEVKVNVNQWIYSSLQSKYKQNRAEHTVQYLLYTALGTNIQYLKCKQI